MTAYTPAELRTLAGSQKTNPFFVSQVSAALSYAADAIDAADKALQAELTRATAQPEQPTLMAPSELIGWQDPETHLTITAFLKSLSKPMHVRYSVPLYRAALAAQAGQSEPVAWHTDDHLTDRSATTYSKDMMYRWKDKGWPVIPLFIHPAPVRQPLTDEDIDELFTSIRAELCAIGGGDEQIPQFRRCIARALEAKITGGHT